MFERFLRFPKKIKDTYFLWGPRQTGKSTMLKVQFPRCRRIDLLLSDQYLRLSGRPHLLREELMASGEAKPTVIIDEIQKIPALLDEVHWLIENTDIHFILCGSSPRKLLRGKGNLLGGRALRRYLFPLVFPEIPGFDLLRALNHGLLPRHYLSAKPKELLESYVGDYLKEEINAEAFSRYIGSFARFLETAAMSNGELVNYSNIARECAEKQYIVKEYFQILEDSLIGYFLHSYRAKPKRRVILTPKFYFFDVGIANFLMNRPRITFPGELFGKAFEHFIFQELRAHSYYSRLNYGVAYWRTASGLEVDFILGQNEVAIEVKGSNLVSSHHLRGIHAFLEEYTVKQAIIVSMDTSPRKIGPVTIMPWKIFLRKLWGGELIK